MSAPGHRGENVGGCCQAVSMQKLQRIICS